MRDMTHVTYTRDMTHWCVQAVAVAPVTAELIVMHVCHDSVHTCDMTKFTCVTWLSLNVWYNSIQVCDMTHLRVRAVVVEPVTAEIGNMWRDPMLMCDVTLSHVWQDSCHSYTWHNSRICAGRGRGARDGGDIQCVTWLNSYVWRDSLPRMTRLMSLVHVT